MKVWQRCALALAVSISATAAHAQAGGYVLFTGANLDVPSTTENTPITAPPTFTTGTTAAKIFGPTLGLYGEFPTPVVKFGADLRGSLLNGSGKQHYSGVVGPRVAVELPVLKLTPYGEFLFGFGSYKTTSTIATTHVDYEYAVGVDRKLFSLLDWRLLEFSYTNYYGGSIPTKALSTGLVVRLP